MNKTLEANSVFLNPTHTTCPTKINAMIKSCYDNLNILETLKGQLGSDQFNYINEYFTRIIMILQQYTKPTSGKFDVFTKPYTKDNISHVPNMSTTLTLKNELNKAEYENQTLSVPTEYKVLTSIDKQLAFNKYGERIVTPFVNNIASPLEDAINASQYIAGNGLDISRHMKPMPLNKYK